MSSSPAGIIERAAKVLFEVFLSRLLVSMTEIAPPSFRSAGQSISKLFDLFEAGGADALTLKINDVVYVAAK